MNQAQHQMIIDRLDRIKTALERLEPPKGSDSGVLLPDTRSGAGDKATKNNGSEAALPDQGWGALRLLIARWKGEEATLRKSIGVFMAAGQTDQAAYSTAEADVLNDRISEVENALRSDLRTQSVADADEVEAAIKMGMKCLQSIAAACDSAAKIFADNEIPIGEKAEREKAAGCRDAFRVLESFLPELSRKERSVSGNDQGDGRRENGPTSPPTSSPFHPPSC